jgi:CRP-like cAMP-binding protein
MKFMTTHQDAITHHPLFQGMKAAHLAVVATGARTVEFAAGEFLFREGEPANCCYLIEQGKVALEAHEPANGTTLVQTLGAGEVLGWSWMFAPFVWHFQARAVEPVSAIVLNGAHLLIAAERDPQLGYELMKRFAQILIHRLQATRRQLLAQQIESVLDG